MAFLGYLGLSSELNILFDAPLEPLLAGRRFCMYRIDGEHASGVLRPTGRPGRWLFGTARTADMSKERLVASVRAAAGDPKLGVEIVAAGEWEPSARVAASFRHGPVLLVGDAGHQHTPDGGFGMNSAIQGVHNLAWKVAALLHHHAGDGLLDTYQTERQPLATSLWIPMLQARGRNSGRTLGIVLGAHYEQGALVPDGIAPPPVGDSVAEYTPCARPGHRAPHLWLDDAKAHSTLDLFGRELMLLTPVPDRWQAAASRALDSGIPLCLRPLRTTDTRQVYGVEQSGAVLVRPDGYVAARWQPAPDAIPTALPAVVGTVLSRPPRHGTSAEAGDGPPWAPPASVRSAPPWRADPRLRPTPA